MRQVARIQREHIHPSGHYLLKENHPFQEAYTLVCFEEQYLYAFPQSYAEAAAILTIRGYTLDHTEPIEGRENVHEIWVQGEAKFIKDREYQLWPGPQPQDVCLFLLEGDSAKRMCVGWLSWQATAWRAISEAKKFLAPSHWKSHPERHFPLLSSEEEWTRREEAIEWLIRKTEAIFHAMKNERVSNKR